MDIGILRSVYSTGVLEFNDFTEQLRLQGKNLLLVKGRVAEEVNISKLLSPKDAYQLINLKKTEFLESRRGEVSLNYAEFVNSLNPSDFIKPNVTYDEAASVSEGTA
ncbi:MAG: hypothetical protein R2744_02265 [Bacteroidales bacterium]